MNLKNLIDRWGGWTESYWFYGGTVELRYDPKEHVYYLVTGDELKALAGVTSVCHIIDKSEALIPWACKQMAGKLLATAPVMDLPTGERLVRMTYPEFEDLVLKAKSAHREKLEDAGEVGHAAHAWIEKYIQASIANAGTDACWAFDVPRQDQRVTNCCLAALNWMTRHNVRWLGTERKIYSKSFGYAGTMDGLCIVDSCDDIHCCPKPFKDRLTIADWKTTSALYPEHLLQTAAYMQAFNEETSSVVDPACIAESMVTDRWLIRLGKDDGAFETWHAEGETYTEDIATFLLTLSLTRAMASIKARVKAREQVIREAEKAEAKAAREAALKIKCKGADRYKGVRVPKCNGGEPCESCLNKYAERHDKSLPKCQTNVSNTLLTNHQGFASITE